jgi:hypothetical protein
MDGEGEGEMALEAMDGDPRAANFFRRASLFPWL